MNQDLGSLSASLASRRLPGISWLRAMSVASLFTLGGCVGMHPAPGLNAVLWHQSAPEYRAVTRTIFGNAEMRLSQALADPSWSAVVEQMSVRRPLPKRTAIILDIDETVLNNSPLYARQARDPSYAMGPGWGDWTEEASATALAGSLGLIQSAIARGVTVFFVSNRSCTQDADTRKNLTELGFPTKGVVLISRNTAYEDPDQVDSCPEMETYVKKVLKVERPRWVSAKSYRRQAIARKFRVLLLFGDSQGDFFSPVPPPGASDAERRRLELAHLTPAERANIDQAYGNLFGERWLALPNAMYGNWQSSLLDYRRLSVPQQVAEELGLLRTE